MEKVKKFGSKVKEENLLIIMEVLTTQKGDVKMSKKFVKDGIEYESIEAYVLQLEQEKQALRQQVEALSVASTSGKPGRKPAEIPKEVIYFMKDILYRELLKDEVKKEEYVKKAKAVMHVSELKKEALGVVKSSSGKGLSYPKGQSALTIRPTDSEIDKYIQLVATKDAKEIKYEELKEG